MPISAVVEFTELVKLQGVLLRGQYLIYNDDEMMEDGKPCLYIYTMKDGKRGQLVIAVHCEPVERKPAKEFTVLLTPRNSAYIVREVREIQSQTALNQAAQHWDAGTVPRA